MYLEYEWCISVYLHSESAFIMQRWLLVLSIPVISNITSSILPSLRVFLGRIHILAKENGLVTCFVACTGNVPNIVAR